MGSSLERAARSSRVETLDACRPEPARAALPVNGGQSTMRGLITEAIRRVGSQKAAAIGMAMDPAQLTRQLGNGHLTVERMEALPPVFAAELGRLLVEEYGALATPQARIRQKARELREIAAEMDQAAELIA